MDSTPPSPWNNYLPVKINKMAYNQDHSLFVLATTRGYRVFDSKTFVSVCKVDDYQDLIGDLALAMTLYKAQLIYFVGNDENISYTFQPPNLSKNILSKNIIFAQIYITMRI